MKVLPIALLTAVLLQGATSAQDNCPQESAQAQPSTIQTGPPGACTGTDYQLAGVQITTAVVPCPTFCIYTPPHDIVVASTKRVRIETAALNPITLIRFRCDRSYFLIIPLGLQCVIDGTVVIGQVRSLTTVPCKDSVTR